MVQEMFIWRFYLSSPLFVSLQVNRAFKVKFDKKHFIGKSSLLAQKNKGVTKKLVQFQLIDFDKDMDMWPGGGNGIFSGSGLSLLGPLPI